MQKLSLIYARSVNHCIGANGQVPWNLPADYQFFDDTTRGHAVIMGRRTYEDHRFKFDDRLNLVLTSNSSYKTVEGVLVADSLDTAFNLASNAYEVFVIGGVSLFTAAFDKADSVYETEINTIIEGDTYLPEFDFSRFHTTTLATHPIDECHACSFTIYRHDRQ